MIRVFFGVFYIACVAFVSTWEPKDRLDLSHLSRVFMLLIALSLIGATAVSCNFYFMPKGEVWERLLLGLGFLATLVSLCATIFVLYR